LSRCRERATEFVLPTHSPCPCPGGRGVGIDHGGGGDVLLSMNARSTSSFIPLCDRRTSAKCRGHVIDGKEVVVHGVGTPQDIREPNLSTLC
jgi:hypothetical protein